MVGNYGAVDDDDYTCHGYYINKSYSSPYTFKSDLSIDGKVISFGDMVCERTSPRNQYQLSLLCFQKTKTKK